MDFAKSSFDLGILTSEEIASLSQLSPIFTCVAILQSKSKPTLESSSLNSVQT